MSSQFLHPLDLQLLGLKYVAQGPAVLVKELVSDIVEFSPYFLVAVGADYSGSLQIRSPVGKHMPIQSFVREEQVIPPPPSPIPERIH